MIKYGSVIGKEVFTVAEGKTFGRVKEVMVNLKKLKAVGFLIVNKDEMFLETGNITTFGEVSLVFEKGEMLRPASKVLSMCVKGRELIGLKVITEKGRDAGSVSTFFFDESGSITHIEVNEGPFAGKGLLAGTGVSFVGPDAVIVKEDAFEIAKNMQSKTSVKSIWGNISKTTKKLSKNAGEKIKKYSGGIKKNMKQIKISDDPGKKDVREGKTGKTKKENEALKKNAANKKPGAAPKKNKKKKAAGRLKKS